MNIQGSMLVTMVYSRSHSVATCIYTGSVIHYLRVLGLNPVQVDVVWTYTSGA